MRRDEPVIGFRVTPFNWPLKRRREALGLSRYDVADAVGCNRSTYANLERMAQRPSTRMAQRIADVLLCPVESVFPEIVRELGIGTTAEIGMTQDDILELQASRALEGAELAMDRALVAEAVRRQLATLPERQRLVIEARYGLEGEGPKSLQEVVGIAGTQTRERVRQIEAQALRRLRHPSRAVPLTKAAGLPPWDDEHA